MAANARVDLSARDRTLLDVLATRVRVLSLDQIARTWYETTSDPPRSARRRLDLLAQAGHITILLAAVRPELELLTPLSSWRPGEPVPDLRTVATRLAGRWTAAAQRTVLACATRPAAVRRGGFGGGPPRRSEMSHDLTLAGIYLRLRASDPAVAESWIPEYRMRRLGFGDRMRLPDALVERQGERVVIELGGEYSTAKLTEFHGFCVREGLRYEIW